MIINRGDTTVVGKINQNKQDLRNSNQATNATLKAHASAINTLQSDAATAAATTNTVNGWKTNFSTTNATVTGQIVGPGNKQLYGWSGASGLPTLTTDSNTGSSWATGERNFINNLNTVVNFILAALEDTGIIVP